jgi:hypothetical protein
VSDWEKSGEKRIFDAVLDPSHQICMYLIESIGLAFDIKLINQWALINDD